MAKKKDTDEIAIARYTDETEWIAETSDKSLAGSLRRKGWKGEPRGSYTRFKIPLEAVLIRPFRSVSKLESYRRRTGG